MLFVLEDTIELGRLSSCSTHSPTLSGIVASGVFNYDLLLTQLTHLNRAVQPVNIDPQVIYNHAMQLKNNRTRLAISLAGKVKLGGGPSLRCKPDPGPTN